MSSNGCDIGNNDGKSSGNGCRKLPGTTVETALETTIRTAVVIMMKEQRDGFGIGLGRVWMQTWICLVLVAVGLIVNPTEVSSCRVYPGRRLPDWLGLCPGRSLSEIR